MPVAANREVPSAWEYSSLGFEFGSFGVQVARLVAASREVQRIFLLGFGRNPYLIERRGFFLFTILKLWVASCEAQGSSCEMQAGRCEARGGSCSARTGRCKARRGSYDARVGRCESQGMRNIPFRIW
jgi:hypothetical protein